jgi:flagellar biosynthesis GTPase FlhF
MNALLLLAQTDGSSNQLLTAIIAVAITAAIVIFVMKLLERGKTKISETELTAIRAAAHAEADKIKAQAEVQAKTELLRLRQKQDAETESMRQELKPEEKRLAKREDSVDQKLETLNAKERMLDTFAVMVGGAFEECTRIAERFVEVLEAHRAEHQGICLDPNARNLRHTHLAQSQDEGHWTVQQVLVDPEEFCDWMAEFDVDLAQSRERGEPVLRLRKIGPMA